jgi:voltage-gated potassium channel
LATKSLLSISQIYRKFIWTGLALLAVLIAGTAGYRIISIGNSSLIDCLYMTLITITTIGFGEIVDLSSSPQGRIFTMFIALCGIGIITYTLSNLTAFIVEGSLNEAFLRRKMEKTIRKLSDHFIVCGIDGVGHYIINELYETKRPHVIVDTSRQNIEKFLHDYHEDFFIVGDATDNDTLLEAGVMKAKGVFAVTGDDNNNLVISITAKQLNPSVKVIACCYDLKNMDKIKKAGADAVISPTFIGGLRMASEMIRPAVVSFLDIMLRDKKKNLRIEEIPVPDSYSGQPLSVLNLQKYPDTLLLAVKIKSDWIFNPDRHYAFTPGTTLIIMTTPEDREEIQKAVS